MMQSLNDFLEPSAEFLVQFDPLSDVRETKQLEVNQRPDGVFPAFTAVVHSVPSAEFMVDDGVSELYLETAESFSNDPNLRQLGVDVFNTEIEFAQEDSLFSGTHGELALRLTAAMIYTKLPESLEEGPQFSKELQKQAKLVFLGYKVWATNVAKQCYYRGKTRVQVGELWDTVPEGYVLEDLAATTSGRLKSFNRTVTVFKWGKADFQKGYNARGMTPERVILAGDASFVFVTTGNVQRDKEVYLKLASALQNQQVNIPVIVVENGARVLRELVTLTPARSLGLKFDFDVELSVVPYLDLKIGAWPPWLKLPQEQASVSVEEPERALVESACPAFFAAGICGVWSESSTLGSLRRASSDLLGRATGLKVRTALELPPQGSPVFARFRYNRTDNGQQVATDVIAVGFLELLLSGLARELNRSAQELRPHVVWVGLNPRMLNMLFGPPLHLFVPEKLDFGTWVNLEDACRLFPGAPKLQLPARLKESSPEDVDRAKQMLNALAPGGWTSNDDRPPRAQDTGRIQVARPNLGGGYLRQPRQYSSQPRQYSRPFRQY